MNADAKKGAGNSAPVKSSSLIKKILIGIVGFFGILILAAIIVPLIIDIDKYRPQIVEIANQNINGKLDIGKMSLSLWGKIEIDIDGIALSDSRGEKLISVKETYAYISLLSFLKGQPRLVFRLDKPEFKIVKDKNGKLNVLDLVKPTPPGTPQQPATPATPAKKDSGEIPMIALIAAAGVDLDITHANLNFKDLTSGFSQDVQDFNLLLKDISMSRPMKLVSYADINTKVGQTLQVLGPFKMDGTITPKFAGSQFQKVDVALDIFLSDLIIDMNPTFKKDKGIPFTIKMAVVASSAEFVLEKLLLNFHNALIETSMTVRNLQAVSPSIEFNLMSNPIDLSSWDKLVPMLANFDLEGRMDLRAKASGPTDKLQYEGKLDVIDFMANTPGLLAKPKMQIHVELETDYLKKASFNLEAPGTDLAILASLKSFSKPNVDVSVNSNGIDLDQLLPPPPPPAPAVAAGGGKTEPAKGGEAAPAPAGGGTTAGSTAAAPATDVDGSLEPLRTNEMLKGIIANIKVRIKKFKGFKIEMDNISVDAGLKQLAGTLNLALGIFTGTVKADANLDLKPHAPTYHMKLNVDNLDLKIAVASAMESLKNTMIGKLSMAAGGDGSSLNSDKLMKNLNLSGNFKIADAEFATIDVGQMVTAALNSGLEGVIEKVPPLKGQKIEGLKNFKSKYQVVSSDFTMKNGVFLAPNFKTVAYKNQGIDLNGRTEVDLVNDKLDATWFVIDTYNVTKANDVNVNVTGVKIDHILAEKGKPVSFPLKVGCKMSAPCYDYKSVPAHFAQIAMNNSKGAISGRIDEEKKKLEEKARAEVDKKKQEAEAQINKKKKEAEAKLKKDAEDKAKDKAKKALKGFGL